MSIEEIERIGRFNSEGLVAFSKILNLSPIQAQQESYELIQDSKFCEFIKVPTIIRPVETRLELAEILFRTLNSSKKLIELSADQGMWSWLAAAWMRTLFMNNSRSARIGEQARWILDKQKTRYYRHLLAGPYFIYRYHYPSPEKALSILCSSPIIPGELVGQVAASSDIAFSVGVEVATKLYVDPKTRKPKKGSGGMGPGSPRRLTAAYLNQIDLTVDYRGLSAEQIIELLPPEFDKFK
jgi:hypothetical protein